MIHCRKCGKELRNPISIALGIGPKCRMEGKIASLKQRDIFMGHKPDFTHTVIDGVLVITDLAQGNMSVTNGIEDVLQEIGNLDVEAIIYRDSLGVYDQIECEPDGTFLTFISLGLLSGAEAIAAVKGST